MEPVGEKVVSATDVTPTNVGRRSRTVRVWDPVVRLIHWSLVGAFVIAWITGDEAESLHEGAGYAIVALLALRLIWGVAGSEYARFADIVHRPSAVFAHMADTVRLRGRRHLGHSPAGGAMVIALVVMLSIVCGSGYALTTDAFWSVEWVEELHETAANMTWVLIGLHLLGVALASVAHRENLVIAMVTGRKRKAPHPG